jgi:predicted anti-sigma-YlaC factor YlaD
VNRRKARQVRRRRRRLRVANFFLAIIRGALAGLLTLVVGTTIAVSRSGKAEFEELAAGTRGMLLGMTVLAFVIGMAYFPWPRSYEL